MNIKTQTLFIIFLLTTHQSKTDSDNHGTCSEDLLKIYGIDSPQNPTPQRAKADSRNLCSRNRYTCCSGSEIWSTAQKFGNAAKSLKLRLEVLEELLTLFIGESYRKILTDANGTSCKSVLEEFKIYKDAKNFEDFEEKIMREKVDDLNTLLNDIAGYKNRNLWFFENQICTVCNPFEVSNFEISEIGTSVKKHVNNCYYQLEISEFEIRLMTLFEEVIMLVVKAAKCVFSLDDVDYKIDSVDLTEVNNLKKEFVGCYEFFDYKSEICLKLCHEKNHFFYQFPAKIWGPVGQSLKILYKAMVNGEIEEYYENVKGFTFQDYIPDDPIYFYGDNESFDKFKMKEAEFIIDSKEGISLFTDHMSKDYMNYVVEFVKVLKVAIVLILVC